MGCEDVLLFRKNRTVKFNFRSCWRCHSQAAAAARLIYCTWLWRVSRRGERTDGLGVKGGELQPTSKGTIAFIHLRLLNLVLDTLLLHSPVLRVTPPSRTFVLAFHTKVNAGTTGWMLLIALLSAEAAGKTAYRDHTLSIKT